MDLKHSRQAAFHQASRADCLRDWYSGPQGLSVQKALRRQLQTFCRPRFGDAWLEVGPLSLLHPEWAGPARTLHADPQSQTLRAQAGFLPLAAETFSCVLLAHALGDADDGGAIIAEAVRVMAPEGHLFLLESGHCNASRRQGMRSALPLGLRRRRLRHLLGAAGLGVRRQVALTVLPAGLPAGWHRRLGNFDATVSSWLPLLGSCVLTVARRRDLIPIAPVASRLRWSRGALRAGETSQWA
jgi:hypothetical protein